MPASFKLEEHGLKKLRVDSFGDLVFGTLSPEAPPLATYIGNLIGSRIHRVLHGKPKILGTTSQISAQQLEALFRECAGHLPRDPAAFLFHDLSHLTVDLRRRRRHRR